MGLLGRKVQRSPVLADLAALQAKIAELERALEAEHKNREALRISEARYRQAVRLSEDIVFEWDFETDTAQFSDQYETLFGEKAVTENIRSSPKLRQRLHWEDLPAFEDFLAAAWRCPHITQGEFRFMTRTGNYVWIRVRTMPIENGASHPSRALGILTNITALKCEMDALTRKSQQDPLTKLLNKEETHCRISRALEENPEQPAAFFIIDVDNFKNINDNLGHQFGDMVLREVSGKISALFRDVDIAGRLGGDEFAVLLRGAADVDTVHTRAAQLLQVLNDSYGDDAQHHVSASIGIALFPAHGANFDALYHLADVAMYAAKRKGKDCYAIFEPDMETSIC